MNVNQHTPMASPYGQPHPGYGQPSYTPLDGGYPATYAPYNGPASAYQPAAPPQGKLNKFWTSLRMCKLRERDTRPGTHRARVQPWNVLLPASWRVIVHVCMRTALCLCILIWISTVFSFLHIALPISLHLPVFAIFPSFLVFQVTLLSQAFPLRLWLPTQSLISPLLLT